MTHSLAHAYAQVGQTETSLRLLTELAEVLDAEDSGPLLVPRMLEHRATVRASLGDHQGALEALREAADLGWINYFWIANDPSWHATLAKPGFEEFLEDIRTEIELQRAIVEQANEQHDFRAEMELLLSK